MINGTEMARQLVLYTRFQSKLVGDYQGGGGATTSGRGWSYNIREGVELQHQASGIYIYMDVTCEIFD